MFHADRVAVTVLLTALLAVATGCQTPANAPDLSAQVADPPALDPQPARNDREMSVPGEENPDITRPHRSWLQARRDENEPTPLTGGPVRVRLSRQTGDVQVVWDVAPPPGNASPASRPSGSNLAGPPGAASSAPARAAPSQTALLMHNGRLRLSATDATADDAATTNDTLELEASWQDDQGNIFAVRCTSVIPGSFINPVYGGVVTNHTLEPPAAPPAASLPGGYAYVAFWGSGQTLKNGHVQDSNVVIQGMLAESVPGQRNHPPMADPLVAAGLRLHLLAGPLALQESHYVRRIISTGCPAADGKTVPFWHVTFDSLTVQTERNTPPAPKRSVRPSLARLLARPAGWNGNFQAFLASF